MTSAGSAGRVRLRRAHREDQGAIRRMVRREGLDPTDLHWSHFMVAELDGTLVGTGQVRPYPRCPELGSLVVRSDLRGQGIAARLIEGLLADQPGDVYLECGSYLAGYYQRFGFEEIPWQQAPMPLKLKAGLGRTIGRLWGWCTVVMVRRFAPR